MGGVLARDTSLRSPGILARGTRLRSPGVVEFESNPTMICAHDVSLDTQDDTSCSNTERPPRLLALATPSSCASASCKFVLTPSTPNPDRDDMKSITGNVVFIFFAFDGTLTASPGDNNVQHCQKQQSIFERAPLLASRLKDLRDSGFGLGIISKSTETTIRGILQDAGLAYLFNGPILGKAVGFNGKAGFIEDLIMEGHLRDVGAAELQQILLVDDDIRELDRAKALGIQTYAAPESGGLQDEDFDDMYATL